MTPRRDHHLALALAFDGCNRSFRVVVEGELCHSHDRLSGDESNVVYAPLVGDHWRGVTKTSESKRTSGTVSCNTKYIWRLGSHEWLDEASVILSEAACHFLLDESSPVTCEN